MKDFETLLSTALGKPLAKMQREVQFIHDVLRPLRGRCIEILNKPIQPFLLGIEFFKLSIEKFFGNTRGLQKLAINEFIDLLHCRYSPRHFVGR